MKYRPGETVLLDDGRSVLLVVNIVTVITLDAGETLEVYGGWRFGANELSYVERQGVFIPAPAAEPTPPDVEPTPPATEPATTTEPAPETAPAPQTDGNGLPS